MVREILNNVKYKFCVNTPIRAYERISFQKIGVEEVPEGGGASSS